MARYIVGPTGVKQIARDRVSGSTVVLNLSKQQKSQTLISLIMEHGCGKQYI